MPMERLQKVLAACGLGSRRGCEQLILDGRATVDGKAVELGTRIDPERQEIRCDGEIVRPRRKVHFLINKPRGYVCTNKDERGRPRAIDLVPLRDERLFTVGRLDAGTEGLLIVTNDGDFAQRVSHPRYGVNKTYRARVRGVVANDTKRELMTGVWLSGRRCLATWVKILKRRNKETVLEITLHEGRNREVRRMLGKTGHTVLELRRVRIGPLSDPALPVGRWRKLRPSEVRILMTAAGEHGRERRGPSGTSVSRKRKK